MTRRRSDGTKGVKQATLRWAAAKRKRVEWMPQAEDAADAAGKWVRRIFRMARFGGWQAKWLASIVMLQGEGKPCDSGMRYERSVKVIADTHTVTATVCTIGLLDIDEAFLDLIVPDKEKLQWLLKGNEHEFFK